LNIFVGNYYLQDEILKLKNARVIVLSLVVEKSHSPFLGVSRAGTPSNNLLIPSPYASSTNSVSDKRLLQFCTWLAGVLHPASLAPQMAAH
jgi:hypothetical protein